MRNNQKIKQSLLAILITTSYSSTVMADDFDYATKAYNSKDYTTTMYYLKKAAAKGNAIAMNNIGILYDNGEGVTKDFKQAMHWYKKSANKGYSNAMVNIGYLYYSGKGVMQDYNQAMQWFQKAAAIDDALAIYSIGMMYERGQGVTQDFTTAMQWFEKAADKDNIYALTGMGELYENGRGVKQDINKAIQLYLSAANEREILAMYHLGRVYEQGLGNKPQNIKAAINWYKKAADKGEPLAMNALAEIYLDSNQINQAVTFLLQGIKTETESTDVDGLLGNDKSLKTLENLLASGKITDPTIRKQVEAIFAQSPLVAWHSAPPASTSYEQVSFSVILTDQGGGIGNVRVLLDGVPVDQASNRGIYSGVSQNTKEFKLIIPEGKHEVTVDAMPAENIGIPNRVSKTITSTYKKTVKPKLHAVVVGINEYQNPKLNLSYAKKDATAVFSSLEQQVGGIYDKGNMTLLNTRGDTSKDTILNTIKQTKSNVTMNDVFVFYVAGHGYNFPDLGYHLFTSDVSGTSARKVKNTGIDAEALQDLLASIKTNKKLILLDTCDSGGSIDANKLLSRGMDEQTVIDRLNRKSGATVLMASADKQKALEGYKNHGLFTYALLQAFRGSADNNKDGYLKTTELSNFIDDEIPTLAKKAFNVIQEPYVSSVGRGFEFKVVQ